MPSNFLVGPALPLNNVKNHHGNFSLAPAVHASRFIDPPAGEYSLGNTLNLTQGHEILPTTEEYSELLANRIYDTGFTTTLITNISYILISPIFLISLGTLLARAIYFSSHERLSSQEEDAETVRVYGDSLGYFLVPFLLTMLAGTMGLINTIRDRINKNKDFARAKGIFVKYTLPEFTNAHKYSTSFYLLLEALADLQDIEQVMTSQTRANYSGKLDQIEKLLIKIVKKLELNKQQSYQEYILGNTSKQTKNYLHDANIREVIVKLHKLISNEKFQPIRKYLVESAKETAINLFFNRFFVYEDNTTKNTIHVPFPLIENYCDRIEKDTYTQIFFLTLLGKRSRQKVDVSTSILIGKSNLAEETALSREMEVLNDFWNPAPEEDEDKDKDKNDSTNSTSCFQLILRSLKSTCFCCKSSDNKKAIKKVIHPFKINLTILLNLIHENIFSDFRNVILNSMDPITIKPEDIEFTTHPASISDQVQTLDVQPPSLPGPPNIHKPYVSKAVTVRYPDLRAASPGFRGQAAERREVGGSRGIDGQQLLTINPHESCFAHEEPKSPILGPELV